MIELPGYAITFSEADEILQEYTATMIHQFPFVPLQSHSACDMYKNIPFLLKTILCVCRPADSGHPAAFEHWFRQHVANEAVALMNKNLELVQSCLIFLAWYVSTIHDAVRLGIHCLRGS